MLRVFVITSDQYLWALAPFSYLFNKYWGEEQEVVVMGYRAPSVSLPKNFRFHSVSRTSYTQKQWSNGLIKFLEDMGDEHCILMLEDYWINRPVDKRCISLLHTFMQNNKDVLRFDLTCDVLYVNGDAREASDIGYIGHYDLVEKRPGKPYRMSFQAGLWNNEKLLSLLNHNKDPWETEIYTKVPDDWKVYGTRQWPLRYVNAIYKGELDTKEIDKGFRQEDLNAVRISYPKDVYIRNYT